MSESVSQLVEAKSSIVIHPGSKYLRIGRPSDSAPKRFLHAVACRRKSSENSIRYADSFLNPISKMERHTMQEIEDCRLKVSHILQSALMSDGSRRFATPPQQVAGYNKRCQPVVDTESEKSPAWIIPTKDVIIGDEILSIHPHSPYNIHFPYKKGDLNLHSKTGGSISSVLAFLEIIWRYCISTILETPATNLKSYRAVLVVPDIYNRDHVKKLTNLLFSDLGFGGCIIVQDHVAATFGAGLGSACVVDVGDQKTSVSCVEDMISHPTTRLRLEYGGGDLTQVLHWLLRKSSFPHPFDQKSKTDVALLDRLKREFCHINLNKCGPQEKTIKISAPGECSINCDIQVGDEIIIAPLGLFYPDLVKITGPKACITQKQNSGDPEDPFDDNFLREVGRLRGAREATESLELSTNEALDDLDEDTATSLSSLGGGTIPPNIGSSPTDRLLSLEQAILTSIERCPNDELKRRMFQTILIVGGGAKFDNLGKWLQNRVTMQIPVNYRPEQVDVITRAKDLDPSHTVWKGAALLACLEGSEELWVLKSEWEKMGLRVLRERCPFIW